MIWLIVAAALFGLFWLPIGIRAIYREANSGVWLLVGPFKFILYPEKKEKGAKQLAQKPSAEKRSDKKEQSGSNTDFLSVGRAVLEFLSHFRRKLRIKNLELKVTLAADDPADLAIQYGSACGAVGALMPQLEQMFRIRKRDIQVQCDFAGEKTHIYARIDATISLRNFLGLLTKHGFKTFKQMFSSQKLQKGGAQL